MRFAATHVDAEPEDDELLASVFLEGSRDLVPEYLVMCRFTDDQDDGRIEIELSEQTRSTHDGIRQCTLHANGLTLVLEEEAARALDTDTVLDVAFALDLASRQRLATTLASIFRDRMERLEVHVDEEALEPDPSGAHEER